MSKDYSPFTPGQPVPVEFFVGRSEEVRHLLDQVNAATTGKLRVGFLTGERGIGKSSLAASPDFANWLKSLMDEIATSADPLPLCLVLFRLTRKAVLALIGLEIAFTVSTFC